jgi:hypothetical protein
VTLYLTFASGDTSLRLFASATCDDGSDVDDKRHGPGRSIPC